MVDKADSYVLEGALYQLRGGKVGSGGQRHIADMVMGQKDICGVIPKGNLHHLPGRELHTVAHAAGKLMAADNSACAVDAYGIGDLVGAVGKKRLEIFAGSLGAFQNISAALAVRNYVSPVHLADKANEPGRILAHALNQFQLAEVCLQHAAVAAEALEKQMGCLICVAAGQSVEKQQLYSLHIAEGLETVLGKARFQPFPVTFVNVIHMPSLTPHGQGPCWHRR